MSAPVLQKLKSLDLAALTEPERQSAILEAKTQLEVLSAVKNPDADVLAQRIEYLKLWHALAKLRVVDVQNDVAPPDPMPEVERMFPAEIADPETHEEPHDENRTEPELDTEGSDIAGFVAVRLIEAGTLRGMRLPMGIVIDVAPEDADHLIETGKARLLEEGEGRG